MPPVKLVYRGWGELTAGSVSSIIVPMWAYSLQVNMFSVDILQVGVVMLPFVMGMLVGIATPDIDADKQVGKRTLPVRVGVKNIATLYISLLVIGYVCALLFLPIIGIIGVAISLPLAVWAWRRKFA